ncbi:TIGR02757 family protein [Capnocytophaga stomatis]|uniref:TIGR02757 family protein n=1 Tax=Capnocytophaga stomatis TaxID=1848904 RepID=UPI00385F2FCD
MNFNELKSFLDEKVIQYNRPEFIETDPIQIPKNFSAKEDIEIAGFLISVIAWGQRKTIISNGLKLMDLLGNSPYDFVMSHSENDLERLQNFVHRTFNGQDLEQFVLSLKNIYTHHNGLEKAFAQSIENNDLQLGISNFKQLFFSNLKYQRTLKHLPDPRKGSVAKRFNMFLRWMVRRDNAGVDFGIWKGISPSLLSCPLDVHSGNVARSLGLITRPKNDVEALSELDNHLRKFDPTDPAKYDFALFGIGVFDDLDLKKSPLIVK